MEADDIYVVHDPPIRRNLTVDSTICGEYVELRGKRVWGGGGGGSVEERLGVA